MEDVSRTAMSGAFGNRILRLWKGATGRWKTEVWGMAIEGRVNEIKQGINRKDGKRYY